MTGGAQTERRGGLLKGSIPLPMPTTHTDEITQPKTVLITGASGLVGWRLTEMLLAQGFRVRHLGRKTAGRGLAATEAAVARYEWDPPGATIDEAAFDGVDAVVHLAGAGVADARWTPGRRREILDSRTQSTQLLAQVMQKRSEMGLSLPECVLSASAIGFYGDAGDRLCGETDPPGTGFLAEVCQHWESAALPMGRHTRLCIVRIGVVLSARGGALPKMAQPMRWFAGGVLGSGRQYMSWIHIDDLCRLFMHLMGNHPSVGTYNAVAPLPVSQFVFLRVLARQLNRPLWTWIPAPALRLLLGGMAETVLASQKVSNERVQSEGFRCRFPTVAQAMAEIFR